MKRFLMIVFGLLFFSTAALAESDYGLSEAVRSASEKLDIPEYYTEFASQIQQDNTNTHYNLSWSGESFDKQSGGNISAVLDSRGNIIYYSNYEFGNFEGDYKLSSLDYDGAEKIAADFIKRIVPERAFGVKPKVQENYRVRNSQSYYIRFDRHEHGVPFYNNYIMACVNAGTHKLTELSVVWDDISGFPLPQGAVPHAKALELFQNRINISLGYYNNAEDNPILMYGIDQPELTYINAYTGEKTKSSPSESLNIYRGVNPLVQYEAETLSTSSAAYDVYFAIEADIKSRLGISAALKPEVSISVNQDGRHFYNITYNADDMGTYRVLADAETLQITGYGFPAAAAGKPVNEEAAIRIARGFAEKAAPLLYAECDSIPLTEHRDNRYNIFFTREVDGIKYRNNGLHMTINAFTGELSSYRSFWSDKNFPERKTAVSAVQAAAELYSNAVFELQYVGMPVKSGSFTNYNEVILVYGFAPYMPPYINGETGKPSNALGERYVGGSAGFEDTDSESVNALKQCGVLDDIDMFYPDAPVSQSDYLKWIYRAVNRGDEAEIDKIYGELYNYNVIHAEERGDGETITVEGAVMLLIRLLGYSKVAELEDTYQTDFLDESDIEPSLIGYAAIAKGMKIVNGDMLEPKKTVTRSAAADIIYNLLTSDNGKTKGENR